MGFIVFRDRIMIDVNNTNVFESVRFYPPSPIPLPRDGGEDKREGAFVPTWVV
jgi:hypothetical protein